MKRCLIVLLLLCHVAAADSLTISPAVVPLGGKPGQSTTQTVTLYNNTHQAMTFDVVAQDVVVRDGQRVFVEAGELPASMAATAVVSAKHVTVAAGDRASVDVTLTVPEHMEHRAVVILMKSTTKLDRATLALGTLLTFDLAGRSSLTAGDLTVQSATPSTNTSIEIPITNDGNEPLIARAAAAILDAKGAMVGKLAIDPRRFLPGEVATVRADYPGDLASGHYRVVVTVEANKKSTVRTADLVVP